MSSASSERCVVQATMWTSAYLGNFLTAQLALARVVRERLDLGTHLVLDAKSAGQPWLADLDAAGVGWSLQPSGVRPIANHLIEVGRRHRAALVHTHFTGADIPAALATSRLHVPCIWHIHTGFLGYSPTQRIKDVFRMRLLARARVTRVVAVAPWIAELTLRRGVPADRIVVVPNGIVLERFAQLPSREQARARLGLAESDRVVLGLAWWPEVKGADRMLDALAALAQDDPSVVGLLVGTDALREMVAQRGLQHAPWLRISGFVSDAAWLYAAADVFLSASRHEGQSYSVGEALACGLPVVMTDIPGVAAYRGAPGVHAVPRDHPTAGLQSALHASFAATPLDRQRGSEEARRWAHAHIGVDRWTDRICTLYEELL